MSQVELPKHLEPERLKQLSVEQLVALIMEQQRVIELLQQALHTLELGLLDLVEEATRAKQKSSR